MADFSVIIPAYNESETLLRTMRAVGKSLTGALSAEVLIVDDWSEDETMEVAAEGARELRKAGLPVETIQAGRRSGIASAKNLGQSHATTPVSVFLDAHTTPGIGALERVAEPLLQSNDVVVTGPMFVGWPSPTLEEQILGEQRGLTSEDFSDSSVSETIRIHQMAYGRGMRIKDISLGLEWAPLRVPRSTVRVQVVTGCCMGVRTDQWGTHSFWWLIELGFLKGTVGSNDYGPPDRQTEEEQVERRQAEQRNGDVA